MQLRKTLFVGLLSISMLSGCVWLSNEEDVATMLLYPKVVNQFHPTIVWSSSVGHGSDGYYSNLHPAWQNNRVFAADRHGVVKALNADSGKEIWSMDLSIQKDSFSHNCSAKLNGGVTAAGNRIYVGSELAKLYSLDEKDGSLIYATTIVGEVLSTPLVSNGLVLVHTSNGMLQALNEADGSVKWIVNLETPLLTMRGESDPTMAFGAVILGGDNGVVSAFMINDGHMIWQSRIAHASGDTEISRINDIQTTPLVVNGVVYALAYNGNLAALDLSSGQIIWSRIIGSVTNLLVNAGRIYLVDQNDCVIAVDAQNGLTLWRQRALLHRNLTSPVLYHGYIVTGDSKGHLHWINPDNGQFVAQQKINSAGLFVSPIIAGNKLIVQAKNGEVCAIIE
ncbi:MAG: outer membrane protein assembly factor BamB [Sodalis sp. (in: enterobacteria)]